MATATKAPKATQKKTVSNPKKAGAISPILEAFPTAKEVKLKGVEEPYFQIPASELEDYLVKQKLIKTLHERKEGPFLAWEEVKKGLTF